MLLYVIVMAYFGVESFIDDVGLSFLGLELIGSTEFGTESCSAVCDISLLRLDFVGSMNLGDAFDRILLLLEDAGSTSLGVCTW